MDDECPCKACNGVAPKPLPATIHTLRGTTIYPPMTGKPNGLHIIRRNGKTVSEWSMDAALQRAQLLEQGA